MTHAQNVHQKNLHARQFRDVREYLLTNQPVKKIPAFTKTKHLLPCSQQAINGPY